MIACPHCRSNQLRSVSTIWSEQTYNTQLSGMTSALFSRFSASGTSSSVLARRLAPPQKKKLSWFVIIPMILLFSLIKPTFSLGTVILLGLTVILPIKIWFTYYNCMIYPKHMNKWRCAWYCTTCGSVSVFDLD
jgi:hypothetical protein